MERGIWYIIRSEISRKILDCLEKYGCLSPKQIAENINIARDNISTRILKLADLGIVECINPQNNNWRFYEITDKGRKMRKKARELA